MFGIGTWELVVILILALLLLGPEKLPDVARKVGRNIYKLKKTAEEVRKEMDLDGLGRDIKHELLDDPEIDSLRKDLDVRSDIRRAMQDLQDPPSLPDPYREIYGIDEKDGSEENTSEHGGKKESGESKGPGGEGLAG